MPILQSIQVGMPRQLGTPGSDDPDQQPWFSGFVKTPVAGSVDVSVLGLAGDGQADRKHHGGPDKAILAYNGRHYSKWSAERDRTDWAGGMFGENFTLDDLSEDDVCIGDSYSVGQVTVQVTQPRQPCWKLGRRCGDPGLPKRVIQTARCGWYLRVLTAGSVEANQPFELIDRPHPDWSVSVAHRLMYEKKPDRDRLSHLAALPQLSYSWQQELLAKATR